MSSEIQSGTRRRGRSISRVNFNSYAAWLVGYSGLLGADQHLLGRKQQENEAAVTEWVRKAELAVEKNQDDLARPALDRTLSCRQMAAGFQQQIEDQSQQVESLKAALHQLELKLSEAQAKSDLLIAQHRRARAMSKATDARGGMGDLNHSATFDRMRDKVLRTEALTGARAELAGHSLNDRLLALGKDDEIEVLQQQIKIRKGITGK